MVHHSFPACTFFMVEISLCALIPLSLCQDQSTVAQWSEMTVVECSLTSWVWARFQIGSHTMSGQGHSQTPLGLRLHWVKGLCILRCNLQPTLLAEWLGSFTCCCSNTGVERTPDKSAHKGSSGGENSATSPAGIWTRNLSITSPVLLPSFPSSTSVGKWLQRHLLT